MMENDIYENIILRMNEDMVLQITVGELKKLLSQEFYRCHNCKKKMIGEYGGFCSIKCNKEFHDGFWNCEGTMRK